jgi:hypothetical protein
MRSRLVVTYPGRTHPFVRVAELLDYEALTLKSVASRFGPVNFNHTPGAAKSARQSNGRFHAAHYKMR